MRTTWAILASLGLAGGAIAMIRPASPDSNVPDILIEGLGTGTVVEQYVAQLASRLRSADRAGDGLDATDVALARDLRRASTRGSRIGQMLARDLNGDLKVTRDELVRSAPTVAPYRDRQVENELSEYDGDRDGVITVAEMAAAAEESDRSDDRLEELLALDPNRDGKLTARELRERAEQAFAQIDTDGDGKLSQAEYAAIMPRIREISVARSMPKCTLPAVPAGAKLLVFGAYEGQAISSVAIGGADQETNLIDVDIEPGSEPLYLVLTSYESMAWRLNGATSRVARVVVSSYHAPEAADGFPGKPAAGAPRGMVVIPPPRARREISASGVIGIPSDRVTIAGTRCPGYMSEPGQVGASGMLAALRTSLGRAPDGVFGKYALRRVALPSGRMEVTQRGEPETPSGFDAAAWREASRYWPGGLVKVDPRQVVAQTSVAPYAVLPSQMGLAQLVGSGALQQVNSSTFRVVRPIAHMPPGMGGAHSVTLLFAKGVPLPPGNPVHSCIVMEGTGETVGATCDMRGRQPPQSPQ